MSLLSPPSPSPLHCELPGSRDAPSCQAPGSQHLQPCLAQRRCPERAWGATPWLTWHPPSWAQVPRAVCWPPTVARGRLLCGSRLPPLWRGAGSRVPVSHGCWEAQRQRTPASKLRGRERPCHCRGEHLGGGRGPRLRLRRLSARVPVCGHICAYVCVCVSVCAIRVRVCVLVCMWVNALYYSTALSPRTSVNTHYVPASVPDVSR